MDSDCKIVVHVCARSDESFHEPHVSGLRRIVNWRPAGVVERVDLSSCFQQDFYDIQNPRRPGLRHR